MINNKIKLHILGMPVLLLVQVILLNGTLLSNKSSSIKEHNQVIKITYCWGVPIHELCKKLIAKGMCFHAVALIFLLLLRS